VGVIEVETKERKQDAIAFRLERQGCFDNGVYARNRLGYRKTLRGTWRKSHNFKPKK
jgi:hypothetical protein